MRHGCDQELIKLLAVLRIRIRIRIHRIRMYLDPDPLVRGVDPDSDPLIFMQK
jgi:hypothetical protein